MNEQTTTQQGRICVYAASSPTVSATYIDAATQLGRIMASHGWQCVNGAGSAGLMRAVSDGCLDAGGSVHGVIPQFMIDNAWNYDRITETTITPDMHSRKTLMAEMADAFIALPGGLGTLEELLECITWRQLRLHSKPIVLLNTLGYYNDLVEMLDHAIDAHFMLPSHRELYNVVATPQQAIEVIEQQIAQGTAPAELKRAIGHNEH